MGKSQALIEAVEELIDHNSVAQLLDAVAFVCRGKAENLRVNWTDRALARNWDFCAGKVEALKVNV